MVEVTVSMALHNESVGWYPLLGMFSSVNNFSHGVIASIMVIILVLAVTGNLAAIAIFLGSPKLRTPSNMLIVNLAVADFLMAITSFPLLIKNSFKGGWTFTQGVCDFYGATATMFGLMSINNLVFISLDRVVVIVSPHQFSRIKYRHAAYCILAVWLYSAIWAIMPLLGWNRYIVEGYGTTCSIDYFTRESPHSHFLLVMFLADFVFPCIVIVLSYGVIFRAVRKHAANIAMIMDRGEGKGGKRVKPMWSQTEYKIARTCLTIIILYCLTWTPYAVVVLMGQYGDPYKITPSISMLPAVFAKLSTVYNPIVYALTHPRFRERVKELLGWVRRSGGQSDSTRGSVETSLRARVSQSGRGGSMGQEKGEGGYKYEQVALKDVHDVEPEDVYGQTPTYG